LFIQNQAEYEKSAEWREEQAREYSELPPVSGPSYAQWSVLSSAIKDGEFLKLSAVAHGGEVEARFNMLTPREDADNGSYEITRGARGRVGTYAKF